MSGRLKTALLAASLAANGIFIAFLIFAASAKPDSASVSFPSAGDGYITAAAVATFPVSSPLVFNPIDLAMRPAQTAFLQYSVIFEKKQTNLLINALYDPEIIAVDRRASGILVTALRKGETVMQFISNDGIMDLASVRVIE